MSKNNGTESHTRRVLELSLIWDNHPPNDVTDQSTVACRYFSLWPWFPSQMYRYSSQYQMTLPDDRDLELLHESATAWSWIRDWHLCLQRPNHYTTMTHETEHTR